MEFEKFAFFKALNPLPDTRVTRIYPQLGKGGSNTTWEDVRCYREAPMVPRARFTRTHPGSVPWELLTLAYDESTGFVTIQTPNGRYLTVVNGGGFD